MFPKNLNPILANNILTSIYNVDENQVYRQINKQIYNETAQTFYNTNQNRKITNREIVNYLLTSPKRFGKVIYETDEEESNIAFTMFTLPVFNTGDYHVGYSIITTKNYDEDPYVHNAISNRTQSFNDIIDNVETDVGIDLDLMTVYNIYKNRGNCIRVNKHYAKEKVIMVFNNHQLKSNSFSDIYYYYQYLLLNGFVFDILDKQYDPIQLFFVRPIDFQENENLDDYMDRFMSNPVDIDLYNNQLQNILTEIKELEPKILNYIHTYM